MIRIFRDSDMYRVEWIREGIKQGQGFYNKSNANKFIKKLRRDLKEELV